MVSSKEIIQKTKSETIDNCKKLNKNNCTIVANKVDSIVDEYKHLYSPEYRILQCKYIYELGIEKYIRLAKTAEQEGKHPARYFSWLLKNEVL